MKVPVVKTRQTEVQEGGMHMVTETFPGKREFRDAEQNYYFSCSHEDTNTKHPAVVVGALQSTQPSHTNRYRKTINSTCPLMGIRRIWDTSSMSQNYNRYMDEYPEVLLRLERAAVEQTYYSEQSGIQYSIASTANNGGFGNSDGTFIAMFPQIVLEDIFQHESVTFREYLGLNTNTNTNTASEQTNEDDDTQDDIIVLLFTEVGVYEINTRVG